jgi:hypothetical protein
VPLIIKLVNKTKTTNNPGAQPQLPPEGYLKVRFLRLHPSYAYFVNQVGIVSMDNAAMLLDDENPYITVLPDDYVEPGPKKPGPEPSIEVFWLKPHGSFAYNAGDVAKLTPDNYKMLHKQRYVRPTRTNKGFINKLLTNLT